MENQKFYSGFAAVIGRANAGKSTLVNRLVGEKVAIVSPKPQTTRNTIRGVITDENYQIVLVDTPGLHKPQNKLGQYMERQSKGSVAGVDVVVLMLDAAKQMNKADSVALALVEDIKLPVIAVLNKVDLIKKEDLLGMIAQLSKNENINEIIPASAWVGDGCDIILEKIKSYIPEGPKYFPEEMYTDQPEQVIASEMIRESVLFLVHDEIPHGVGVDIRSMQYKPSGVCEIHADIMCERDSHKGIIIGKQGAKLKEIGIAARKQIERMLGAKVNLKIWGRVKPDWRNKSSVMKDLGYHNE
jgi:GTP-binding protein Era